MGRSYPSPMVLGPVGLAGIFRRNGEILAAKAAHRLGVPYCLSMFSVCSLSSLRRATDGEIWSQLYVTKDRNLFAAILSRVVECAVDTICITVDTPAGSFPPRDIRSSKGIKQLSPRTLISLAARPRRWMDMIGVGIPQLGGLEGVPQAGNALIQSLSLESRSTVLFPGTILNGCAIGGKVG